VSERYAAKEEMVGAEAMRYYERFFRLNIVDAQWKDHLRAIDHLKEGINLRAYGQKDPLVEYKKESFDLFEQMLYRIDEETVRLLHNLQIVTEAPPEQVIQRRPRRGEVTYTKANASAAAAGEDDGKPKTVVNTMPKVGRNEACPCGSGKKYKKCHGADLFG
jgi:preprotein translocase subunit SecA